jgi:AcrR family transcriptional regulator
VAAGDKIDVRSISAQPFTDYTTPDRPQGPICEAGHNPSVNGRTPENGAAREARKQHTRRALLDAALQLLAGESFSSLSLRQVTRSAGVVPTAFYRHFANMDELGRVLIDESFRTLRAMIRAARADPRTSEHVIRNSVEILVGYVHEHESHFRFIARERFGGVAALRHAIHTEIRLFASDLATDLARLPGFQAWSSEDLQLMASLMVDTMVSTAHAIIDAPPNNAAAEAEIIASARRQLRMITLGVPEWRSSGPRAPDGPGRSSAAHGPPPDDRPAADAEQGRARTRADARGAAASVRGRGSGTVLA